MSATPRPRIVVVGLGLNSKATSTEIIGLISAALAELDRTIGDVDHIATTERRRSHGALAGIGIELRFFPAEAFAGRDVCERAAALAVPTGVVLVPKRCSANVCVCVIAPPPPD